MTTGHAPIDRLMIRADAAGRLTALQERLTAVESEMDEIYSDVGEDEDLDDDQFEQIEKLGVKAARLKSQIEALSAFKPVSMGRKTAPGDTKRNKEGRDTVPGNPAGRSGENGLSIVW